MAINTPPLVPGREQDPFQKLRLMGTMGPYDPTSSMGPISNDPLMGSDGMNPEMMNPGMMNEEMNPSYEASDRFSELLGSYPGQKNRGMLEKIALSMMALNDPRLVAQLMQQPSQEQVSWEQQIGPAEAAMVQERYANQNLRQIAEDLSQQIHREIQAGQEQERIDISRERLELDRLKAENPNMNLVSVKGGNYLLINPQTGAKLDTGVKTGTLTDQDEAELRIETQKEIEGIRQEGRQDILERGHDLSMEELERREELYRTRPLSGRSATSLEERRALANRAKEVINRNPEWADHVTIEGDQVTIDPPTTGGWFSRGPTPEMRREILNAIYGSSNGSTPASGSPKVGDTKTFPNGNTGRWDGTNWILVEQ